MLFNKNLGDLIEVMKMAATLQFNQFRVHEEPAENFYTLLNEAYNAFPSDALKKSFPKPSKNLPGIMVLISPDGGFLGELNTLLINRLLDSKRPEDEVVVLGQQGINYLSEFKANFTSFESPGEKLDPQKIGLLRDYLVKRFFNQEVSHINVVYSRFVNISVQQPEMEVLLPLERKPEVEDKKKEIVIEPNIRLAMEGWIKLWLDFRFYYIFWSSKLAEFAARIMHLEGSVQELTRINQNLRMEYFKYLHGLSDKSIRELSSARVLRKDN